MEVNYISLLTGEAVPNPESDSSPTVIVKSLGSRLRQRPQNGGGGDACQCCALSLCCGELCCGSRTGRVWCVNDICGILCAVFTWILLFYAINTGIVVLLLSAPNFPFRFVHVALYLVLITLALLSHLRAMCTDPVSVQKHSLRFLSPPYSLMRQ